MPTALLGLGPFMAFVPCSFWVLCTLLSSFLYFNHFGHLRVPFFAFGHPFYNLGRLSDLANFFGPMLGALLDLLLPFL